jgi:hypothetical protein
LRRRKDQRKAEEDDDTIFHSGRLKNLN